MYIKVSHLNYIYEAESAHPKIALEDISFSIPQGQFVGIIGHTGSGKSTLIQHMNGLLKAGSGEIFYQGQNIYEEGFDRKRLRFQVGLVFQHPEYQLFEETVQKDVCFGARNQGLPQEECERRAKEALHLVGLGEEILNASPFDLSGGQKRRVAIAGVLAMRPKVLVLDEPTAGLDPRGRDQILEQIRFLHEKTGMTVVLVSHSMENVAQYVQRILVLEQGRLRYDGTPEEIFSHRKELEKIGLGVPQITCVLQALKERGLSVKETVFTVQEAAREIEYAMKREEKL